MSLVNVSQYLANKGRNGDTMLVHMAPEEVSGLQALARAHGTSLTRNPHTGLPEAFSLKSLLPAIAGMGLTALSGGALSPLAASLIVGGGTGLASGDLSKGLMAGLGAYGGGGLGQGLLGMGAEEAAKASLFGDAAGTGGLAGTGAEMGSMEANAAVEAAKKAALENAASSSTGIGANWDMLKQGAGAAMNDPSAAMKAMGGIGQLAKTGMYAAAPALMEYGSNQQLPPGTRPGQIRDYSLNRDNQSGMQDTGGSAERRYFADTWAPGAVRAAAAGGIMALTPSADNPYITDAAQLQQENLAQGGQAYAGGGGISSLGHYSDGGRLLRGPGDGVSDSIPATIGGKRPAALADGEFVVPARHVSELGNGSTEAGSRQLYAMLDRIQNARKKTVGKGKVATRNDPRKLLPA